MILLVAWPELAGQDILEENAKKGQLTAGFASRVRLALVLEKQEGGDKVKEPIPPLTA
jgi:hypothetical protein